jgi:hypothetical protein
VPDGVVVAGLLIVGKVVVGVVAVVVAAVPQAVRTRAMTKRTSRGISNFFILSSSKIFSNSQSIRSVA